ncbi:hypothetical protein F4774DRAFT_379783 [Daldinia eschscholtzii]|nr:hypothetical protein F4774DRAFT_379783 [Daldinia eschscholtzii]
MSWFVVISNLLVYVLLGSVNVNFFFFFRRMGWSSSTAQKPPPLPFVLSHAIRSRSVSVGFILPFHTWKKTSYIHYKATVET